MEKLDLQTTVVCRISEIEISSTLMSRFRGTFSSFSFLKLTMLVPLPMKMSLPHDSFAEPARRWPTPILASNTNASPEISPPVQRPGTARGSYARTTKLECGCSCLFIATYCNFNSLSPNLNETDSNEATQNNAGVTDWLPIQAAPPKD